MNTRQTMLYKRQPWINFVVASLLATTLLTSCASSSKSGSNGDHLIPQQGLTVQQIYREASSGENNGQYEGEFGSDDPSIEAARAQVLQIQVPATVQASPFQTPKTQFALMDNPSVPIYVYPHLVKMGSDEVPVDGYATTFFLYSQNHYALPWEHY